LEQLLLMIHRPKIVTLIGKGQSEIKYRNMKDRPLSDELWCINESAVHYNADKIWAMDDLRMELFKSHFVTYLKTCPATIITSKAYPEYPTSIDFPLEELLDYIGDNVTRNLLANTACYALLWAEYVGVEELYCWGIDLGETPPELALATSFMLGRLVRKGVKLHLGKYCKLQNMIILPEGAKYYGYYNN
jgi:hypothetical protein